jgi:hypothetical protein
MQFRSGPQEASDERPRQRVQASNDRPWTAIEKHKLRGFVDRQQPTLKIAHTLRRSLASVVAMASDLGLPLSR